MSMQFNRDGSCTFFAEDGSNATQTVTGSGSTIDAAYATFLLAHPLPPLPPAPVLVHAVPSADPGMTGALFITGNTLHVSQGPSATAIQIGATGPTGQVAVI